MAGHDYADLGARANLSRVLAQGTPEVKTGQQHSTVSSTSDSSCFMDSMATQQRAEDETAQASTAAFARFFGAVGDFIFSGLSRYSETNGQISD